MPDKKEPISDLLDSYLARENATTAAMSAPVLEGVGGRRRPERMRSEAGHVDPDLLSIIPAASPLYSGSKSLIQHQTDEAPAFCVCVSLGKLDFWDSSSHLEAMSQTVVEPTALELESHQHEVSDAKYSELRNVLDAIISALAPGLKMQVVSRYLEDTTGDEYQNLVTQPVWLRMVLRTGGDALVVKLLKDNWEHTGTTAIIRNLFGIPSSTLHREKDRGGVIAYRRADKGDFVYPLEQFSKDTIHGWAGELVGAVGNGDPALQFLYTKRGSLGGKSFAEAFRENAEATVEPFRKSIRRLAAE